MSQDSSSEFKDSGIEERENLDNSSSDIQQDFPSLPSTSGVQQVLIWIYKIFYCGIYQNLRIRKL